MPARCFRPLTLALGVAMALAAASCGDKSPSQPSCTFTIASTTQSFSSSGGNGTAALATAAGCNWAATADSPWVTFPSGNAGSGSATIEFTVAANGTSDARKTTLTVAGHVLPISQEGRAPCDYVVMPASLDVSSAGETTTLTVTSAAGCQWTATSDAAWITITSGTAGTGAGTVTLAVAANAAPGQRTASLGVAGRAIPLRQAGDSAQPPQPVACEYSVSPVEATLHWHATVFTLNISTSAGCGWTATASEGWLSLDRMSGSGAAALTVSFSTFTEDAARRAAIQVRWPTPTAGQNSWITQEGCRYGLDPAASFPATGGTRMITVVTQALSSSCATGCPWTATSTVPWIRITSSMPRSGDDAFSYQVDPNTGLARAGTVTVAGRAHLVSQAGL